MALGAGRHAFRPRVDAGDGTAELPGRQRHQRMQGKVELAAEAAAARRRHDAHRLGPEPHHVRDLVAIHVGRLGRDMDLDAIAHPLGPTRLGLDIGVFDESRLEHALGHGRTVGECLGRLAAPHPAIQQKVCRLVGLHQKRVGRGRTVNAEHRRLGCPGDRHLFIADGKDLGALAHQRHHRLAAVAHLAVGEHRLVLDVGVDAEAVERHVGGGQHGGQPLPKRRQVAQGEAGARMRRAHDADPQRVGRNGIGAEEVAARHLGHAVDLLEARANGCTGGRCRDRHGRRRRHHGLDDLAVAGAAAEHAAQRILDLGAAGLGVAAQQFLGRHQHARRADAALGGAMGKERFLQ